MTMQEISFYVTNDGTHHPTRATAQLLGVKPGEALSRNRVRQLIDRVRGGSLNTGDAPPPAPQHDYSGVAGSLAGNTEEPLSLPEMHPDPLKGMDFKRRQRPEPVGNTSEQALVPPSWEY